MRRRAFGGADEGLARASFSLHLTTARGDVAGRTARRFDGVRSGDKAGGCVGSTGFCRGCPSFGTESTTPRSEAYRYHAKSAACLVSPVNKSLDRHVSGGTLQPHGDHLVFRYGSYVIWMLVAHLIQSPLGSQCHRFMGPLLSEPAVYRRYIYGGHRYLLHLKLCNKNLWNF